MNTECLQKVPKEEIPNLSFPSSDVLTNESAIAMRRHQLAKAQVLGNGYKGKVRIQFHTTEGPREVNTTVWDVSEGFIGLKTGTQIPIHAISGVFI